MKRLSLMATFIGAVSLLCGCNHVHDKNAKWQYNETTHWRKCSCGEEFDKGEHTINENDCNCPTCGYHDPMFVVNDKGLLTGLTNFGKNYKGVLEKDDTVKHNDFSKANTIGENAFAGCQASKIIIPTCINAIHKSVFTETKIKMEFEGETRPWEDAWVEGPDGYRYRENVYTANVAMINGIFYPTLKEAIESVKEDNTIIKIVKDEYDAVEKEKGSSYPTIVKKIILESLSSTGSTKLNANFDVFYTGQLEIGPSITYSGSTNLQTQITEETCGTDKIKCLNTSTIYFPGKKEAPTDAKISYYDLGGTPTQFTALGDIQTYKDEILGEEVSCYAYGVFKFERDSKTITGLNKFGQTITKLTISEFCDDSKNNKAVNLAKYAFNVKDTRPVEITIGGDKKLVKVTGQFQKGIFNTLKVRNGLSEISQGAFSFKFDRKPFSYDEIKEIERKICKLTYVELGGCVNTINENAFEESNALIDVVTTADGLKEIKSEAFYNCSKLRDANFSKSNSLRKIGKKAFYSCDRLNSVNIPYNYGWRATYTGHNFAPKDLNPQTWASMLYNSYYADDAFEAIVDITEKPIYAYDPNEINQDGVHTHTVYSATLKELSESNVKDGSCVHITKDYNADESNVDITIEAGHSLYIQDDSDVTREIKIHNLTIKADAYVILGPNIIITGQVTLIQGREGGNLDVGGIAFTYNGKHPNINIQLNEDGKPTKPAASSKITVNLEGNDTECYAYGLCQFRTFNSVQSLYSLSHLGAISKEIEIGAQTIETINSIQILSRKGQELKEKAFCEGNEFIKKVIFGDKLTIVGTDTPYAEAHVGYAFYNCPNLETVVLGQDVETIGEYCFKDCPKLMEVITDNNTALKYIKQNSFENCTSLTTIKINEENNKLNTIEANAFKNTSLSSFDMPKDIRKGWKVDGNPIEEKEFEDLSNAAHLLREIHVSKTWVR